MDKLVIKDIKLSTRIGIHPWEQQCNQNLHLDLALQTNAKAIAEHDDIQQAINYDEIVQHILHFVKEHQFKLIETLAEQLAQQLLMHFSTQWVQITLHKPGALQQASDVAIMIERVL